MSRAVEGRLEEVLERHGLTSSLVPRYLALLALLADPRAPTAVHDPACAVDVHVADSLEALSVAELRRAQRIVDLGSGAGLPGLALAIALPAHIFLVESQARKAAFLSAAVRDLALPAVEVVHSRVEDWRAGNGLAEAVTARALAPAPVVLEYAAPLLRLGGALVDWRSGPADGDVPGVCDVLGLRATESRLVTPYADARELRLDVYLKARPTPESFPRRAGMARKRPLQG